MGRLSEAARALAASPSGLLHHLSPHLRWKELLQVQERSPEARARLELEKAPALLALLPPLFCRTLRPLQSCRLLSLTSQ